MDTILFEFRSTVISTAATMTTSHLQVVLSKEWSYIAFKIMFYFHKSTEEGTEKEHIMTAHKLHNQHQVTDICKKQSAKIIKM